MPRWARDTPPRPRLDQLASASRALRSRAIDVPSRYPMREETAATRAGQPETAAAGTGRYACLNRQGVAGRLRHAVWRHFGNGVRPGWADVGDSCRRRQLRRRRLGLNVRASRRRHVRARWRRHLRVGRWLEVGLVWGHGDCSWLGQQQASPRRGSSPTASRGGGSTRTARWPRAPSAAASPDSRSTSAARA